MAKRKQAEVTRRRSTRKSAQKALEGFKKISRDENDEMDTEEVVENGADDDPEYTTQNEVKDEDDESTAPDGPDEDDMESTDGKSTKPKSDTNALSRKRTKVLELWKDFYTAPAKKRDLKEVPEDLKVSWRKLFGTNKKPKRKSVKCPNKSCGRSFTTYGGMTYHYERCSLKLTDDNQKNNQKNYTCKLCNEIISSDGTIRGVIPHMLSVHPDQMPPVPDNLKEGLEYRVLKPKDARVRCKKEYPDGSVDIKPGMIKGRNGQMIVLPVTRQIVFGGQDYVETTQEYRKELEIPDLYINWKPLKSDYKCLTQSEYEMYLPQAKESCNYRMMDNDNWSKLGLFEAKDTRDHRTFFVGAPVRSAAWVPYPNPSADQKQYVAIATGLNFDDVHSYSESETEVGLIQIWDMGLLKLNFDDENDKPLQPKFSLGLSHPFGSIWDMEWAPFGNSYEAPEHHSSNGTSYPRLGLLAIACGDGEIKILSVPHPDSVVPHVSNPKYKVCPAVPVVVLQPPQAGPSVRELPSICRCLSWSKVKGNMMAGGYGNGIIAVWNLETTSRFMVVQDSKPLILDPLKSWIAHGTSVNSIVWCPYPNGANLLASGGTLDRDVIIWDMEDLAVAKRIHGRGVVTDMDWPFRWSGLFASYDDAYLGLMTSVNYLELSELDVRNTLSSHKSCVWSLSYSDWLNTEASVDSSGEGTIFRNFVFKTHARGRTKAVRKAPLYRMTPRVLDGKDEAISKVPKIEYHSYDGITNTFGIEFHDTCLNDFNQVPDDEILRLNCENMSWLHPSHYPLVSMTQVKWNPNEQSYSWIFTGSESGFCRISCCSYLIKPFNMREIFSGRYKRSPDKLKMIPSHSLLDTKDGIVTSKLLTDDSTIPDGSNSSTLVKHEPSSSYPILAAEDIIIEDEDA